MSKRTFHISNRVEIPEIGKATAGGLDEAIAEPLNGYEVFRFGWDGKLVETEEEAINSLKIQTRDKVTYGTFSLPRKIFNDYYNAMANGFLWALFHYRIDLAKDGYDHNSIPGYYAANKLFAKIASTLIRPDDDVIVHDYHLIPCGKFLQENGIENPTSFFLHIPAPSNDLLEGLDDPRQQEFVYNLLESLYHYDFVGLQSQNDFLHLKSILYDNHDMSLPDIFNVACWKKNVIPGRNTKFGPFPVAGNTDSYIPLAKEWATRPETLEFMRVHAPNGRVDTLAVDRVDYSKGLVAKAYGVGRWLNDFAKKGETLNLMQIAPFGRDGVMAYQHEKAAVEAAFNGLHAIFGDPSVLYKEKVPRPMWLGMSRLSKMGLVTPMRDGFNLVACEMLASYDPTDPGVLVLSKHAGAAGLLKGASVQVDPMRPISIAEGIQRGRKMSLTERQQLHGKGMEILESHSNERWQKSIIEAAQISAAPRLAA